MKLQFLLDINSTLCIFIYFEAKSKLKPFGERDTLVTKFIAF